MFVPFVVLITFLMVHRYLFNGVHIIATDTPACIVYCFLLATNTVVFYANKANLFCHVKNWLLKCKSFHDQEKLTFIYELKTFITDYYFTVYPS